MLVINANLTAKMIQTKQVLEEREMFTFKRASTFLTTLCHKCTINGVVVVSPLQQSVGKLLENSLGFPGSDNARPFY
jgi:hypothetical protein